MPGTFSVPARRVHVQGREQRRVVTLGAARGEDDLVVVLRAEQGLQPLPRLADRATHLGAEGVHRRRIAELLGEVGQHGLDDAGIHARGGVVVEVDGTGGHGSLVFVIVPFDLRPPLRPP